MEFIDSAGQRISVGDTVHFVSEGIDRLGEVTKLTWKSYRASWRKDREIKTMLGIHITAKPAVEGGRWDTFHVFHNPKNLTVQVK